MSGSDTQQHQSMINLQSTFIYQNRQTGQPSTTPLTVHQLCRILCPPNSNNTSTTSIITPQTLLLGYNSTTHTYDESGWKAASSISILKEACTNWYYEDSKDGVKGPITTRALAELLNNDNTNTVNKKSRVFPVVTTQDEGSSGGEWKSIQDLKYLQLAIESFSEAKAMPSIWPANNEDTNIDMSKDVANMTYQDGDTDTQNDDNGVTQQKVNDELEAFLNSTDNLAPHASVGAGEDESDEEEYESDGGTRYVKDKQTGNWIHEALAPKKDKKKEKESKKNDAPPSKAQTSLIPTKKRKRNKAKFSAKNARNWIYVSGLPKDTNEEEVAAYFQKVGIIDLDPETQKPKVKLYRTRKGENGNSQVSELKGDASICYARPESVELALQILDENLFRDDNKLSVQRAKFEQHGTLDTTKGGRRVISEAKRKVARLAALQAVGWDEGENGRIAGGLKGLRIVVLMNMFDPKEIQQDKNDVKLQTLEKEVHTECEAFGVVEKITVFSKHPSGVIIIKFTQPNAASDCMNNLNGKIRGNGRKVDASYWDGVTDYTCRDEEKEEKETEKRLDEFGDWLEDQELPDEFKLQVEE